MTIIKGSIKQYPISFYFILTFLISWSAILIFTGPDRIPATKDIIMVLCMAMLLGPSVASILLTDLLSGRATVSLRRDWSGGEWKLLYIITLLTAPSSTLAILLVLSIFSSDRMNASEA